MENWYEGLDCVLWRIVKMCRLGVGSDCVGSVIE